MSFEIKEDDTLETRRKKLYLGIMSIGEQLYSIGAAVSEQLKTLNRLEQTVANMRKEFNSMKGI